MSSTTAKPRPVALITPRMLEWARERCKLSIDELAEAVRAEPKRIAEWELGLDIPTMRQAEGLADALHIPFGYLFLSSPPVERLPLKDFRTVGSSPIAVASPDLLDLLYDVLRKQQWYREYLQDEQVDELPFVASANTDDDPDDVADGIRSTIGLNGALRERAASWEDYLRSVIRQVEAQGILVLSSGVVAGNPHRPISVDELRGFAVVDRIAPLVFINARDAKAAQIFTLAHELAHVWVGESGISNVGLGQPGMHSASNVERFCNAVAAELLLPRHELRAGWHSVRTDGSRIEQIGRQFKVSALVVLRRALDLGLVSRAVFEQLYPVYTGRLTRKATHGQGGGDFYRTLAARNGNLLLSAVIEATSRNRLLYRDAARLLNVHVPTIVKLRERSAATAP